MPSPFLPSPIAHGPGTYSIDQEASPLVVGPDKSMNMRNPLYRTDAEDSVSPFLRRCMEAKQADQRDYVVLPGGRTAYTSLEARRRRCPSTPSDFPHVPGMPEELDKATFGTRVHTPPRSSARLAFPTEQSFMGHNRPVSTATRR